MKYIMVISVLYVLSYYIATLILLLAVDTACQCVIGWCLIAVVLIMTHLVSWGGRGFRGVIAIPL